MSTTLAAKLISDPKTSLALSDSVPILASASPGMSTLDTIKTALVAPGATLTLATDIITVTTDFHLVAGQSGSADDIATINGGVAGRRLVLRPSSDSVTITVVDTGNIVLAGAADFVMDSQDDTIGLIYDAARSKWLELSRSNNG